ncbi:MAG: hypothetical protein GEU83_15710 [Pseudonocardiaceae bacterium]|nr:hypothetical protein [Pseudonocardiaceae bacterium]
MAADAGDPVVLTCGDARWPRPAAGVRVTAVTARPGGEELAGALAELDGGRLVVCGTDADLNAVVLRLLRTEALAVPVGYVPSSASSVVARRWAIPVAAAAAVDVALHGVPDPVPLIRDTSGGVLVGLGVIKPVRGVAYCDDQLVLRGQASRLEVTPDPEHGLLVRVVHRRLLGRRVRMAAGRAVQLGCAPTEVLRDGVPAQTSQQWTWYRHTEDLRLVR